MTFIKSLQEKYRSDKIFLAEWILAIATGAFIFLTSSTWDLQSLTQWSVNVWHVLFNGHPRDLYAYTAQNVWHVHHAHMGSELLSVLPWSIWNFPLFLIERFNGTAIVDSAWMLAYSKLFLVLLSVVMLIFTKKITMLITGDKTKSIWAMFLSASSLYLYLSVCYSGQNEIFMILASVIAVYCLLKKRTGWFIFWSALAIAIKPFFLLPFLAVLVLFEKNILKIIGKAALSLAGLVGQKLLFMGAPGYSESMNSGPAKEMLEEMFPKNIPTSFGQISLFAICLVLIYIYSYSRDFSWDSLRTDHNRVAKYAIYVINLTYMSYLMFSPFSFYRVDILVPFLYIMMVQNEKMVFYTSILDVAMQFALMMQLILRSSIMFNLGFVNRSVFQRLLGYYVEYDDQSKYMRTDLFLAEKFPTLVFFRPMFSAVAVICGILLLVFNHPDEKYTLKVNAEKRCRVLLWIRILTIVPFAVLTLYLFTHVQERVYL